MNRNLWERISHSLVLFGESSDVRTHLWVTSAPGDQVNIVFCRSKWICALIAFVLLNFSLILVCLVCFPLSLSLGNFSCLFVSPFTAVPIILCLFSLFIVLTLCYTRRETMMRGWLSFVRRAKNHCGWWIILWCFWHSRDERKVVKVSVQTSPSDISRARPHLCKQISLQLPVFVYVIYVIYAHPLPNPQKHFSLRVDQAGFEILFVLKIYILIIASRLLNSHFLRPMSFAAAGRDHTRGFKSRGENWDASSHVWTSSAGERAFCVGRSGAKLRK